MAENHGPNCPCDTCAWFRGEHSARPEADQDDSPTPSVEEESS